MLTISMDTPFGLMCKMESHNVAAPPTTHVPCFVPWPHVNGFVFFSEPVPLGPLTLYDYLGSDDSACSSVAHKSLFNFSLRVSGRIRDRELSQVQFL